MTMTQKPRFPASLVLAGAGKMGGALLRAWLDRGFDPAGLYVLDPNASEDIAELSAKSGFALNAPAQAPEVLVLAIKPQALDEARSLAALAGPQTLVISILAGKTIANLAARLPDAGAIIRAMPNLPASVGRGVTGLAASAGLTEAQRGAAEALIGATGAFEWVDNERLIDAITAISGSGPAYVFYLVECLAEAGAALGLPAEVAARLARATVAGAGELLFQSESSAALLRESVTSRGGTTAAALEVLMADDALAPLILRAVKKARDRAEALSG
ncbi:pyrroline-5-carboxylate reductase [Methylocella tundrae]|uniref:Pyrroline-5-carboxylate reductase n=1 Tax=Methylocella tundrae TaxID=227605 RepID=A0A4U8YWC7_METTU|nr:pyrroline-5-carboxylate reductase [Methylocella tundrae]WPP05224.1 pyrroline-5-carboxylate reductase [Methylocella tundrae]VFU07567.1 Pyrroline-5-carboxylate reductase [Methylocella tundrae]